MARFKLAICSEAIATFGSTPPDGVELASIRTRHTQLLNAHPTLQHMNAVLVKKALEIVRNPSVLVNMVSQRVRQLNSGAGGKCNPLVADIGNLGPADIALREIIEDKLSFEFPEFIELTRPTGRGRRRPQHWARV